MVLPPMVYVPTPAELAAHFKHVARETSLPIMLYNNPPAYRTNIDVDVLDELDPIRICTAYRSKVELLGYPMSNISHLKHC